MRRAVIAVGWAALVLGWWLVWRGEGVWGCGCIALFALIRLVTARQAVRERLASAPRAEAAEPAGSGRAPGPPERVVEAEVANPHTAALTDDHLTGALPADPDSDSDARWRRLVWVSYGNAFLQAAIKLEDWYRHSLLWPALCSFRDGADRRLVAEDGFAWLSELRQRGALRLSLDQDDELPDLPGIGQCDPQVITCHFADRCERWRMGEEESLVEQAAQQIEWEARSEVYPLWGHGGYVPALDAYWRLEDQPVAPPAQPTDWAAVEHAVARALRRAQFGGRPDLALEPDQLFFRGDADAPPWARFPVLPNDPALRIPHRLLEELMQRHAAFRNENQPKNEYGFWAQTRGDPQAMAALDAYGQCLLALIGWVQRLSGSETRWRPRPLPRA